MGATWGWALAVAAVVVGGLQWGWQGVALAVSVTVFWLLLQFNRAVRTMRQAGAAPVGRVGSAVMVHARMRRGMRLLDIIPVTRSLGQPVPPDPGAGTGIGIGAREAFIWGDESGARVRVNLVGGRVVHWALERPAEDEAAPTPGAAAAE